MSKIVGIDLGTTNSLVATVDSGIPLVMADGEGRRLTPSVVHFPGPGLEPIVGHPANRVRVIQPQETIYSVKRFMGRRLADLAPEEKQVTYRLASEGSGSLQIEVHGRRYRPDEISAEILRKLKRDAEAFLGETVDRAVITVPAYFNDSQRSATKQAGELAGFAVERILNEPTAAALAYGLNQLKEESKIAVYDLGGGTFDLSILELNHGVFQVLATNGNTRLGGDDLDRRLVDFLAHKIKSAGGLEVYADLRLLSRLREAAEQAKIRLSSVLETEVHLPFLTPTQSFQFGLTRKELEDLTRDLIGQTRSHCLRALADAKVEPKDLDQVLLVGGQTRMPMVRQFVAQLFGCVEFTETRGDLRLGADYHRAKGPALNTSQNPDEAVALGAAIQAEILDGGFTHMLLLDVTPLSLGLETFGGLMNVIIPRNSTIPTKAGEVFTTAADHQTSMLIHVLQGERERARDNWSLGKFTVEFERAPRGMARVGVQFEIDANGILHVLARDLKTGQERTIDLTSAADVDNAAVQLMVEESVEHAFEDLQTRQWVESKLRAEATVAAARKGMQACVADIDAAYRENIQQAINAVEAALAVEIESVDRDRLLALKNAGGDLDEITRPLADILMDKAMATLLEKQGLISG